MSVEYQARYYEMMLKQMQILNEKDESSAASPFLFALTALTLTGIANTPEAINTIKKGFGVENTLDVEFIKSNWPHVNSMQFHAYLLGVHGTTLPFPHSLEEDVVVIKRDGTAVEEQYIKDTMDIEHKVPEGDCVIAAFSTLTDEFKYRGEKFPILFNRKQVDGVKMPRSDYNIILTEEIQAVQLPMQKGSTLFLIEDLLHSGNRANCKNVLAAVRSNKWELLKTTVTFPEFKLDSTDDLGALLKLTGVSTYEGRVTQVQASCMFKLDEKGVEAKGKSEFIATRSRAPPNIAFEREFWSIVVDNATQRILFMALYGRGVRPAQPVHDSVVQRERSEPYVHPDHDSVVRRRRSEPYVHPDHNSVVRELRPEQRRKQQQQQEPEQEQEQQSRKIVPQRVFETEFFRPPAIKLGITVLLHESEKDVDGIAMPDSDIIQTTKGFNYNNPKGGVITISIVNMSLNHIRLLPVYVAETGIEDPGVVLSLVPGGDAKLGKLIREPFEADEYYKLEDPDSNTLLMKIGFIGKSPIGCKLFQENPYVVSLNALRRCGL